MNFIQRFFGTVFPPYRHRLIQKEQGQIFSALIDSLPEEFANLKQQVKGFSFLGLSSWTLFPEFKFITKAFPGETIFQYKKRGQDFKISGIKLFSKKQNAFVDAALLIHNNLIAGLRIDKSNYELSEFDISKVNGNNATKSAFNFPPGNIDKFIESLEPDIKEKINPGEIFDIEFGNRIFFVFYDMEDGNYLAVDKNQRVYSLVHDAKPMIKLMKTSFSKILSDIATGRFDKDQHLDERYRGDN
jgi:hypothetical protein